MKKILCSASAIATAFAFSATPTASYAAKGGIPAVQGIANGNGSVRDHPNRNDPQPLRGNDGAQPEPEPETPPPPISGGGGEGGGGGGGGDEPEE